MYVEEGEDENMNENRRCKFRVSNIYIQVLRVIGSGIRYNQSGTNIQTGWILNPFGIF